MHKNKIKVAAGISLAEGGGLLAALLSGDIRGFYNSLIHPPLAPPGWVFPVAWILLYAAMGIASSMVSQSPNLRSEKKGQALVLYGLQLGANFIWCILFFRWQLLYLSILVILLLDVLVVYTILAFRRISTTAAVLMVPYLVWLLYATYLNTGITILNR